MKKSITTLVAIAPKCESLSTNSLGKFKKNSFLVALVICLILLNFSGALFAQNNPSAMLDVASSNKGVLIPRVALSSTADISTIVSPATSLLVYNTATVGIPPNNVSPGFYYWLDRYLLS